MSRLFYTYFEIKSRPKNEPIGSGKYYGKDGQMLDTNLPYMQIKLWAKKAMENRMGNCTVRLEIVDGSKHLWEESGGLVEKQLKVIGFEPMNSFDWKGMVVEPHDVHLAYLWSLIKDGFVATIDRSGNRLYPPLVPEADSPWGLV